MRANPFHKNLDEKQPGGGAEPGVLGGEAGGLGAAGPLALGGTGDHGRTGGVKDPSGPGSGKITTKEMQAALGNGAGVPFAPPEIAAGEGEPQITETEPPADTVKRKRRRARKFPDSWKMKIATRVCRMASESELERVTEMEMRLQRNAKLRQWTEGKTFPWPDASDVAISDMMMDSLRQQDTLHNAAMQTRPVITVTAEEEEDMQTQEAVENHLDVQLFEEQDGEDFIGDLAEAFVNEGHATVFTPWVREERMVRTVRTFGAITPNIQPGDYFREILAREFPGHALYAQSEDFFDWSVVDPKDDKHDLKVSFYTNERDGQVEMDTSGMSVVYDGPKCIVKYWREVLAPQRCKNLQAPSPKNPGGAAFVIIVDTVSVDELIRLKKSNFYDLLDENDIKGFLGASSTKDGDKEYMDQQDDAFEGKNTQENHPLDDRHKALTRFMCFDLHALYEGAEIEDVIFWVIKETKTLCRAKYLTEQYPANPPRRPLSEGAFVPWMGRREGIGLPELVEGLYDMKKQVVDQGIDAGTLANTPFFFYKPHSALKPEVLTMAPGDGMPLQDPSKDIKLADFSNRGQEFMFNTVHMLDQMREQLTMLGDIQRGAVPAGKSSALRTAGGIRQLLQQGEARPERIIRRYMSILKQVVSWMHDMNSTFLSDEKKFLAGTATPGIPRQRVTKDMYRTKKRFSFKANILNSSRAARQESLEAQIQVFVTPIAIQLGIMQPDGIWRLFRDWAKVHGSTDPEQYLTKPTPQAHEVRITADDAFRMILDGRMPEGFPSEGAQEHIGRLQELSQIPVENIINGVTKRTPAIEMLGKIELEVFGVYARQMTAAAEAEQQMMARQEAAAGLQQQMGNSNVGGRPANGQLGDTSPGQLGPGQVADKSLPSERGLA
jgi:hypothetical protein